MDTDTAWELWGLRDPYYGVLANPKFRASAITPLAKEEFFALGRLHVDQVLETCRRRLDPAFHPQRVLDFGCGVGRTVIPFASIALDVVGVDVAPSMLAEARRNCDRFGCTNVSLVRSDDSLTAVDGNFDFVHSCIVLQHIEIARGRAIFSLLVEKIRPGGCGAIHVTFGWDVHATSYGTPPTAPAAPTPGMLARFKAAVRKVLWAPAPPSVPENALINGGDPEMQMNFYNLNDLMFILQCSGVGQVYSEMTNHGGALGVFLFFQK